METETKRAVIELTTEQWEAVRLKAKSIGLSVTAYIRMLALEAAK